MQNELNKQAYINPKINIVNFNAEDIIATSLECVRFGCIGEDE